jgi:hypothetical protein
VFDGPEDFNGLRNRDKLRVWEAVLDGTLAAPPTNPIIIGNVNVYPLMGKVFAAVSPVFYCVLICRIRCR